MTETESKPEKSELEAAIDRWLELHPGEEWPYKNKWGQNIAEPTMEDLIRMMEEEERLRLEAEAAEKARLEAEELARKLKQLEEELAAQLAQGLNQPRSFIPRPYQVEGAVHLRKTVRGMIYDQPGLGKTLQACMALTTPAIISCPGYLVDQWCDFIEDQYPNWKVARINSLLWREQRQELLSTPHDVWVVNHEMWASRREPFKGGKEPKPKDPDYSYERLYRWKQQRALHYETAARISYKWPAASTLVIDESHHMRNKDASQSENCATFADTCQQVILLTATPQYKDVRDWWHQLRIMDPRTYRSYRRWLDSYCYLTGWNDSLIKVRPHMAAELRDEIAKVAIGRTYEVVGLFLPDLIEKVVKVNWHPDLKKMYKEIKNNLNIKTDGGYSLDINPGSVLHTLRMMTACPEKIDAVKHIIEDIPDEVLPDGTTKGAPVIVFCWYRDTAELCEAEFSQSPSSVEITGAYSQKERLRRATDITTRVKCVTMASMSEGVDWSEASTVIFVEEDYTPGKIYQALSRVRRHSTTGKKEPIVVYYVHMRESVDEAIHQSVTERQGDVRRILRRALK